jgi:hypothetical protein
VTLIHASSEIKILDTTTARLDGQIFLHPNYPWEVDRTSELQGYAVKGPGSMMRPETVVEIFIGLEPKGVGEFQWGGVALDYSVGGREYHETYNLRARICVVGPPRKLASVSCDIPPPSVSYT